MGGKSAKENQRRLLTNQEYRFIEHCFKVLSHDRDTLKYEDLQVWTYLADPDYVMLVQRACFRQADHAAIKLKTFAKHFYTVVKGNVNEKASYIIEEIFCNTDDLTERISNVQMITFVSSILRSFCCILSQNKPPDYISWNTRGVPIDHDDLRHFTRFILADLEVSSIGVPQLERWLYNNQIFCHIWREVLINLCMHLNAVKLAPYPGEVPLPECRVDESEGNIHSNLTIASVMFINYSLPTQYRRTWTLLFSSQLHGENFTYLVARIIHQGPSVVLITDDSGHLFGGCATTSWSVRSNFYGEDGTFLFTIKPHMSVYRPSGLNNHFQYLNMNQQTMPNGLGMGGQLNYWGMWLDASLTNGQSSDTCTTFSEFKRLSGRKDFQVRHVEIWGITDRMISLGAITTFSNSSILTTRNEDRYFLQMAGHTFHSEGEIHEDENEKY